MQFLTPIIFLLNLLKTLILSLIHIFMAGGGVALVGITLIPLLSGLFG